MPAPRPGSRAEQRRRTETRILDAAARVFAAAGYERATIRAVASAAGVDAGLVMHYFGSKQELFRRVIDAPVPEVSGAPGQAAEQILTSLADRLAGGPGAALALFRSALTSPGGAAAPVPPGPDPPRGRQCPRRGRGPLPGTARAGHPRRRREPAGGGHQR